MSEKDLFRLSRGAALLLLLGGPGIVVLRGGGWPGYLLYSVYILVSLALFDRARDRWRTSGRAVIWFDLAAAAVGTLFCLLFIA